MTTHSAYQKWCNVILVEPVLVIDYTNFGHISYYEYYTDGQLRILD